MVNPEGNHFQQEGPFKGAIIDETLLHVPADIEKQVRAIGVSPEEARQRADEVFVNEVIRRFQNEADELASQGKFNVEFGAGGNLTEEERAWVEGELYKRRLAEYRGKKVDEFLAEHARILAEREGKTENQ